MKDTISTTILNLQVERLQHQVDSLKSVSDLDRAIYRANEQIEIVNQINELYDSAWTKLLVIGALVIGVGALAIPYLFNLMQKRDLKNLQKELSEKLSKAYDEKLTFLNQDLNQKHFEGLNHIKMELDTYTFYNQANLYFVNGQVEDALSMAIHGAHNWLHLKNLNNPEMMIQFIRNIVIQYEDSVIQRVEQKINIHTPDFSLRNLIAKLENPDMSRFKSYVLEIKKRLKW